MLELDIHAILGVVVIDQEHLLIDLVAPAEVLASIITVDRAGEVEARLVIAFRLGILADVEEDGQVLVGVV